MIKFIDKVVFGVRRRVDEFFHKENGEVNIVAIVVLIGIAVLLAIFFKDQIAGLLKGMFGTIENGTDNALKNQVK